MKKLLSNPIVLAIAGVLSGIFSKYCDIAEHSFFLSSFGLMSSGVLIWLVICTVIMFASSDKLQAALSVAVYIFPMLAAYYLYSAVVLNYIWKNAIIFWLIMGLLSFVLAYTLFDKRYEKNFCNLYFIASVLLIIYDGLVINEIFVNFEFTPNSKSITVIAAELALALLSYTVLKRKSHIHSLSDTQKRAA